MTLLFIIFHFHFYFFVILLIVFFILKDFTHEYIHSQARRGVHYWMYWMICVFYLSYFIISYYAKNSWFHLWIRCVLNNTHIEYYQSLGNDTGPNIALLPRTLLNVARFRNLTISYSAKSYCLVKSVLLIWLQRTVCVSMTWWRHQMEMFSALLDVNKRLSKQLWGWWFETPSRSLWRHCQGLVKSGPQIWPQLTVCVFTMILLVCIIVKPWKICWTMGLN